MKTNIVMGRERISCEMPKLLCFALVSIYALTCFSLRNFINSTIISRHELIHPFFSIFNSS
jgi:hypothetical protein